MTDRISDERLESYRACAFEGGEKQGIYAELQQSRALLTELRALAERMRRFKVRVDNPGDEWEEGEKSATNNWLFEIDSLLASHGSSQADAEGKA